MTEELKLRECPFCGGEMMFRAALWPSDGDSDGIIHKDVQGGPDGCCGVMSFSNGTSDRQIIAAWNARAHPTEVTQLVKAATILRKAFIIATGGKSPFCQEALKPIDAALVTFKEVE